MIEITKLETHTVLVSKVYFIPEKMVKEIFPDLSEQEVVDALTYFHGDLHDEVVSELEDAIGEQVIESAKETEEWTSVSDGDYPIDYFAKVKKVK